jgi:hypothetical protein
MRDLLEQTFERFGYVRVPDPAALPSQHESRELLIREFQLALLQQPEVLLAAETRPDVVRAALELFSEASEKVKRDLHDAEEYGNLGPTEDERLLGEAVDEIVPAEWQQM